MRKSHSCGGAMSQGKTCGKRCAFLYKALTTTPLFRGYNAAEVEKICGLLKARRGERGGVPRGTGRPIEE